VQPSYDAFYAEHFRPVSLQLFAYFGDSGDAADVTQEAFCRAWQRWSEVCRYDDPAAWVRRVAWRLAISRWRRIRTALAHRGALAEPLAGPDIDGVHVDLVRALATLPPEQRRAVVLFYLADLSVGEIAEDAGVAEGTVKSWLHRGRLALRSKLDPYSAGPSSRLPSPASRPARPTTASPRARIAPAPGPRSTVKEG
jgi:RNA polymerase sigma-70 factor (ECF subfamily)